MEDILLKFIPDYIFPYVELARYLITLALAIVSIVLATKKRKIKFSELLNNLLSWIEEAETHTTWTGEEKRKWVLSMAFKYCYDNHIKYEEEKVEAQLEREIAYSKSVNNKYHAPEEAHKTLNSVFTKNNREDNGNA